MSVADVDTEVARSELAALTLRTSYFTVRTGDHATLSLGRLRERYDKGCRP